VELSEIREIARNWVVEKGKYSEPWGKLESAIEHNPKAAFRIIEEIHHIISSSEKIDYKLMGLLAAGHLENLLCDKGPEVIGDLEFLASNDEEFRKCLCGVWKSEIDDEIYARVQSCMHPTHEFA